MSCYLLKSLDCIDRLYEHIKTDYILRGVETVVDFLLDESTIDVIRKYEQNLKSTPQKEGIVSANNIQLKIIGIKLFLLYQKGLKMGSRFRERFIDQCRLIITSLGHTSQYLQTFAVVQKTSICIHIVWQWSRQTVKRLVNNLRVLGYKVKYHPYSKKLLVYGNDVKELCKITFQVIFQFLSSTIQLKRSRVLYNKVMSKYTVLKTDYQQLKQQSEILSFKIQSEGGDQDIDLLDIVTKKVSKALKGMKSEDNLYQKRKDSFKGNGQILQQVEDRSENLQMSKMEESQEYETVKNFTGSRSRIGSRQIVEPPCYMSSRKSSKRSSLNEQVVILNSIENSPQIFTESNN